MVTSERGRDRGTERRATGGNTGLRKILQQVPDARRDPREAERKGTVTKVENAPRLVLKRKIQYNSSKEKRKEKNNDRLLLLRRRKGTGAGLCYGNLGFAHKGREGERLVACPGR